MVMKTIFIFILSISLWSISYAQLPKKRWLPQRSYQSSRPYWAIQPSLGMKKLAMTPTNFLLNYNHPFTDSLFPNQQNIKASKSAGGQTTAFNATLAFETGFTKGLLGEIRIDLIFTKPLLRSFEVGAGWNFELTYYENERLLTIRPVLDLVWLTNNIKIGSYTFPENVPSIAMVDAIFERKADLNFKLKNRAVGLRPRLSLSTPVNDKWLLRADVGYLFILTKKSEFKITQENINQAPYYPEINDPRLNFTMNGILSNKDLFTYSGLFTQLGIARKFGDNRDNGRKYKNQRWR
ncbi:hypothetical protein AD998_06470 [bacterium 336/3]|nr:hypothetical protein AD998_06470 [bacterium 336/3]